MKKLKNNISQTQCALPDADEFTKELADQVYKIIAPSIRSEIKSSVGATMSIHIGIIRILPLLT